MRFITVMTRQGKYRIEAEYFHRHELNRVFTRCGSNLYPVRGPVTLSADKREHDPQALVRDLVTHRAGDIPEVQEVIPRSEIEAVRKLRAELAAKSVAA